MTAAEIQTQIEEATFDYTMGDHDGAVKKLEQVVAANPAAFEAWHALAEVHFHLRQLDPALLAAEQALKLQPEDLFINTTLSRIWMERGDKAIAEKYGAKAKMLSWKDQLKNPADHQGGIS
jgi:cytochrome c-type biogenesis protein CcmH/NrfG